MTLHRRHNPKAGRSGAFPTREEIQRRFDLEGVVKTPRAKARAAVLRSLMFGISSGLNWREARRALKELRKAGLVKFGRAKSDPNYGRNTARVVEGALAPTRPAAKSSRKERRPWR